MFRRIFSIVALAVALAGCGIANNTFGGGSCPFKSLTFHDGGKVDIMGRTGLVQGTYTLKGETLTVSALGGRAVFLYKGDRLEFGPHWARQECRNIPKRGSGGAQAAGGMGVLGLVLFIAGWVPLFWAGKRRFNRTNAAGVEEFNSFGHAVASRLFEKVAILVGVLVVFGGLAMMVTNWT